MRRYFYFLIIVVLFSGCTGTENKNNRNRTNHYAQGFQIKKHESVVSLTVYNPWEKAENVSVEYILIPKNAPVPDSLLAQTIIRTPVERVICLSTTHLGFMDVLNETDAVVGISGSQYVSNRKIRQRMENGEVPDVGYGQNLNYELIVNQKPDVVLVYGVGGEVTNYTQKLEELGIPIVFVAEYLEESPLGKAEWIKFIGTLFGKEKEAGQFFTTVENEYKNLKKLVAGATNKPKILVGSPYKDSWWIPGGDSYLANLIADAGGDYLGKENRSHESYVISFEHALAWSGLADVWINMGNMASKQEILSVDERFGKFPVFKNGKLFNNVKRLSNHGGNDFWESGTVHPHWILNDLILIFYPELTDGDMIYYQEVR